MSSSDQQGQSTSNMQWLEAGPNNFEVHLSIKGLSSRLEAERVMDELEKLLGLRNFLIDSNSRAK